VRPATSANSGESKYTTPSESGWRARIPTR
jgi:hypothetical protein